jgi:NADPH:quinone reductase-like Zn-dependent oxidoreductase
MKAMRLTDSAQKPTLIETDVPQPKPRAGEVLVRVHAAGVTPTELFWYPTSHMKNGEKRTGAVLSHEFSGEIAEIGAGVLGLSIGQEIYGMNDWFADGALAEYCVTQPGWIAPKPPHLGHAAAAAVPIGALTAWQGLFGHAKLRSGERVLVHGGAGAVGIFAIQLARLRAAHVITTVSAYNFEFVKDLGADEVIDYNAAPFETKVRDIDVVFDAVGGDTLKRSWNVLKQNGRLVTIAAESEGTSDERTKRAFFIVEPNRQQLIEIGDQIEAGDLRPVVDTSLPWAQASDAYAGNVERKRRGKVVVVVAEPRCGKQEARL